MATRSPEGRHGSPVGSEQVEEAPSAQAELKILVFPVDGETPAAADGDKPRSWFATFLRRVGLTIHARFAVPFDDANEMLATVRVIGLTAIWAVTVLITLAITLSANVSVPAIITISAIELAGFTAASLSRRRKQIR